MTEEQIAELEALSRAATPPPWDASEWWLDARVYDSTGSNGYEGEIRKPDLSLIVAAVNAIPRLLEERRRLLEALRGYLTDRWVWSRDKAFAAIAFAKEESK